MLAGFSVWSCPGSTLKQALGKFDEEDQMPIAALLGRIRKIIPGGDERHYDEIVRGFGNGALRPPVTPMSDSELARAIADFLKDAPSAEAVSSLGRRFDPSSPV
jgi:hypothetical protein